MVKVLLIASPKAWLALTAAGVMAVFAAVGMTAFGALGVFTEQQTSPSNAFSTGSVTLGITPATAMFTVTDMAPGDVVYSGLQVSSSGSLDLRYALSTTPDGASILDEQLDLTIDVVTGAGVDATFYTADDVVGEANVYGPDGILSAAAIGSNVQGADSGDRVLAAGANERLRFKVTLPLSTDSTYESLSATVAFVFDAEQTQSNP